MKCSIIEEKIAELEKEKHEASLQLNAKIEEDTIRIRRTITF